MNGRTAITMLLGLVLAGTAAAAEISGKVVRDKQVQLRNAEGSHLVVLVQSGRGRSLAVDLGSAVEAGRVRGTELSASGPVVRVGDRAVLMATNATADGKPLSIKRAPEASAALQQYGTMAQAKGSAGQKTVSGTVARTKEVARGRRGANLVVAIRTEQGEVVTSDLGPAQLALGEDLANKPIRVEGQLHRVGDRLVLFADRYRTGGRVVQVDRPERRYAQADGAPEQVAQADLDRTLTLNVGEELLGSTVKDGGGDNLGIIEEAVADTTGVIRYVLISPSEQVGQPKAVPWHALRKTDEGYLLPMTAAQFAEAPTYPPSGDIALADRGWHEETFAYYGLLFVPIRTAFNQLDADDNGTISPNEAEANARLSANFTNADANEDGRISPVEFSAFEAEAEP